MFSLAHCTKYRCGMNGYNYRAEADAQPLAFCPECLAKISFACHVDIREHCRKLAAFCRKNGLSDDAKIYEGYLAAL